MIFEASCFDFRSISVNSMRRIIVSGVCERMSAVLERRSQGKEKNK
jgi:hypothetical protein